MLSSSRLHSQAAAWQHRTRALDLKCHCKRHYRPGPMLCAICPVAMTPVQLKTLWCAWKYCLCFWLWPNRDAPFNPGMRPAAGDGLDGAVVAEGVSGGAARAQRAQRGAAQAPHHWRRACCQPLRSLHGEQGPNTTPSCSFSTRTWHCRHPTHVALRQFSCIAASAGCDKDGIACRMSRQVAWTQERPPS